MDEIMKDLNKLKEEIATSKQKISQLEGRKEELVNRLKNESGLSTTFEAHKKVEKELLNLDKLKAEIVAEYTKLKSQYEW